MSAARITAQSMTSGATGGFSKEPPELDADRPIVAGVRLFADARAETGRFLSWSFWRKKVTPSCAGARAAGRFARPADQTAFGQICPMRARVCAEALHLAAPASAAGVTLVPECDRGTDAEPSRSEDSAE